MVASSSRQGFGSKRSTGFHCEDNPENNELHQQTQKTPLKDGQSNPKHTNHQEFLSSYATELSYFQEGVIHVSLQDCAV